MNLAGVDIGFSERRRSNGIAVLRDGKLERALLEAQISNFNISVGMTERFMEALERDEEYDLVQPRTGQVLFADLLCTGHIQECVRFPVQPKNVFRGHSIALAIGVIAPKRPPSGKAMRLQNRRDFLHVV